MPYDRVDIKRRARELMQSAVPRPILVTTVFFLASLLLNYLGGKAAGSLYSVDMKALYSAAPYDQVFLFTPENIRPVGAALDLVMQLVGMLLSAGFTIYALSVSRHLTAGYATLLDGFGIALRVLWLNLLLWLFTTLWTLLFVVPGIIAAYSYRQAMYLLLDHPDWSCWRCIQESKALMRGHKWELFLLDLSFFGWLFLTALFFPLMVFTMPYTELSYAEYYNRLVGVSAPEASQTNPGGEKPPWEY